MSDAGPGSRIKVSPPNDIYTLLVIVATLFLLAGTIVLAMQSTKLFGTWLPLGPG